MKKILRTTLLGIAAITGCQHASAFDLSDLLGGDVGNMIEGVFMKSDLTTDDLIGVWTNKKPAVVFKGDNFLKQAGGIAAASAVESKLTPYFNQFGLTGATLIVNSDSTFTLKSKKLNLSGNIRRKADGNFIFAIKAFDKLNLGEVPAYVQKTSSSMDVMFDTTKFKALVTSLSKVLNIKSINTIASLLDSYDGLYVGFGLTKTGSVDGNADTESTNSGDTKSPIDEKTKEQIGNTLKGLLNGSKK